MNFNDALLTSKLITRTNYVPMLVGERGIGKSALAKQLAEEEDMMFVSIDVNLLKEGEVGGLPTIIDIKDKHGEIKRKETVYALHHKLSRIEKLLKKNPEHDLLLFLDEFNRAEHSVQQELMNLILNRDVNGHKISDRVKIICAMNPSNKYEAFKNSDYQVTDMDAAQEDRLCWITLDPDVKSWIEWGSETIDEENNISRINSNILEYIATFPDNLNKIDSKDDITPSPRSWERVSTIYNYYLENKKEFPSHIFYNTVKSNVGPIVAQEFITFLKENKNPIIKPEEVFESKGLSDKVINKISLESPTRLTVSITNCLRFIEEGKRKNKSYYYENMVEFISELQKDFMLGIIILIKKKYPNIYEKLADIKEFVDMYHNVYKLISSPEM